MGAFFRSNFTHVDNVIPVIKTITWLLLSRFQGNKLHRNSPEPSDPSLRNLHQHPHVWQHGCLFFGAVVLPMWTILSPKGVQNNHMAAPVKVASQQTIPELSGTFRTLPPEPILARTGTLRNPPEPSGICLRNLHQYTKEPSQTCLPNLPEPCSGTSSCDPHRHTPELIWAEDPICLRYWGI